MYVKMSTWNEVQLNIDIDPLLLYTVKIDMDRKLLFHNDVAGA